VQRQARPRQEVQPALVAAHRGQAHGVRLAVVGVDDHPPHLVLEEDRHIGRQVGGFDVHDELRRRRLVAQET